MQVSKRMETLPVLENHQLIDIFPPFALSLMILGVGGEGRGTGVWQGRNYHFKSLKKPLNQQLHILFLTLLSQAGVSACGGALCYVGLLEYYLSLFEWLIITFTFQIRTKFQQLVL